MTCVVPCRSTDHALTMCALDILYNKLLRSRDRTPEAAPLEYSNASRSKVHTFKGLASIDGDAEHSWLL